jgi:hypothetical protein
MIIKFFRPVFFCLIIAMVISSCIFQRRTDEFRDFTTKGFLNDNCYQSIVEFFPDADAKGLVKQRESSMAKVKGNAVVEHMILQDLIQYCIKNNINRSFADKKFIDRNIVFIKNQLAGELESYVSDGDIVYKYYSAGNSVLVLHRIERRKLKDSINSINISTFFPKEK